MMFGDIFGCCVFRGVANRHSKGRGQEFCLTVYSIQESLPRLGATVIMLKMKNCVLHPPRLRIPSIKCIPWEDPSSLFASVHLSVNCLDRLISEIASCSIAL